MPLDADKLLALEIPDEVREVHDRDAILYALAVGLGRDGSELDFVYERDLVVVPSMATVLAYCDGWLTSGGIALEDVFHAGQRLVFHAPVPTGGEVTARNRIAGLVDKGNGKPALILQESQLLASNGGAPLVSGLSTLLVRNGGGFGGSMGTGMRAPPPLPERAADARMDIATRPDQATLFRLLGDRNPLHIDPQAARSAGFDRPILHGACTFGIACAALLRHVCDLQPAALAELECRFAAPAFPGDDLSMELWQDGDLIWFKLISPSRDATVLDSGFARLRP